MHTCTYVCVRKKKSSLTEVPVIKLGFVLPQHPTCYPLATQVVSCFVDFRHFHSSISRLNYRGIFIQKSFI